MNKLLLTLSFFISLTCLISQSWALPPCPSVKNAYWNNCFGTYEMSDGSIYIGDHKNGKGNGRGTMIFGKKTKWADDVYVGEVKNDIKHGFGTYDYKNGDKYVGTFKSDKKHGQGTYTYNNGKVKEGIWKDGKFMYAKKLTSSSNPKIEEYKSFCSEIGFTPGTEKFGECVVEAMKKG